MQINEEFDTIKEAYAKYNSGDSLSDNELDCLTRHMTMLEDMLLPLGMKFFLARKEISNVARSCVGFQNARKEK